MPIDFTPPRITETVLAWSDLESSLKPVLDAGIFVQPKDKGKASEFERQRKFVTWMRRHAPQCLVFAIPNGSKGSDWERIRKQGEGAVKGFPDLGILWDHGSFYPEFKDGQGNPSPSQIETMNRLHRLGFRVGIYRTAEVLIGHLIDAGAPVPKEK